MNKLRLKFSKKGPIKFVGHLDIMRYFQKAIRRAGIDIKYSEGYSPHQIISFAQPLSVGATSDGEYLDITVNSMISAEDVMEKLNSVMSEGIKITAIEELDEHAAKAMTSTYAAKYHISFRETSKPDFDWIAEFEKYFANDKLPAKKKTKSGEKEIDMKPMILDHTPRPSSEGIEFLLSMSSSETLKPALLFSAFFESMGRSFNPSSIAVHRIDIYKLVENGTEKYIEPFITSDINERFYLNG